MSNVPRHLLKKDGPDIYNPINPYNYIQNIIDERDDEQLENILDRINHIEAIWQGDKETTRISVNTKIRKHGLYITYSNGSITYTEYFIGSNQDALDENKWKQDMYWQSVFDTEQYYPDEEDLTVIDKKFQFKNSPYNPDEFSGTGKIFLRKNIHNDKNLLYQSLFNTENTIYIIRYDFDLDGNTIKLPKNCVLDFYGGSIKNGKLILNNTRFLHLPTNWKEILNVDVEGTVGEGQIIYIDGYYQYWNGAKWIKFLVDEDASIDIVQNKLDFTYRGGVQNITIKAIGNWTIKVDNNPENNIMIRNNKTI